MSLRVLKTLRVSPDGVQVVTLAPGDDTALIPESLRLDLIKEGYLGVVSEGEDVAARADAVAVVARSMYTDEPRRPGRPRKGA